MMNITPEAADITRVVRAYVQTHANQRPSAWECDARHETDELHSAQIPSLTGIFIYAGSTAVYGVQDRKSDGTRRERTSVY